MSMRTVFRIALSFGLLFASGLPSPAAAQAPNGEEIYKRACAACHDGAMERAPARPALKLMPVARIHLSLTVGLMKAQAASLSENERVALARYLGQEVAGAPNLENAPRCRGTAARFSDAPPPWSLWGIDSRNTRFIPAGLAGLTKADLPNLKVTWARAFPSALRARSQPAFAAGAIFVGSHDGTVYALDQATGCVRWTHRAPTEVRTAIVVGPRNAGESASLTLFFGDFTGGVHAVDARTGKPLWSAKPDTHVGASITASPVLFEGRLYVAVSSTEVLIADDPGYACCTFRGSLSAYDAATGRQLWQSYTIPQPAAPTSRNSAGTLMNGPSGAPIWGSPSVDAKRRRLYVATGENYSTPADGNSDSIMAFDMDTGARLWKNQATTNDAWNSSCGNTRANCPSEFGPDADFGAATLFITTSDGRDLVIAGQKSGALYALNPDSGIVMWQTQVGRGGGAGGVRFGMAASGDRLFVPTGDSGMGTTGVARFYPGPPQPGLYAIDLKTGAQIWNSPSETVCDGRTPCRAGNTAAITAAGDMVLVGGRDGFLRIHDANDGKVLWRFETAREFPAINGGMAQGGAFSGGAGPVVYQGRIYLNSGYAFGNDLPGNLFLALGVGP